jgi:hypothetical protein
MDTVRKNEKKKKVINVKSNCNVKNFKNDEI